MTHPMHGLNVAIVAMSAWVAVVASARAGTPFDGAFAPAGGWLKPEETAHRAEICLNGKWEFQPVAVPKDFKRGCGEPPALPAPVPDGWDSMAIKIPSPWNVNTWGGGRDVGEGTSRPYWPDSIYFPSYPANWDKVEMGWLRRSFRVPPEWVGRRIILHFEAVAGDCQVIVNGRPAGAHFDKYLPFELDVTRHIRWDSDNELLVGVRAHGLFNRQSERYPKMRLPYPCGSATERLAGIWQDVFLLGLPGVRVEDAFVKPWVDRDLLEIEITVRNDDDRPMTVTVGGSAHRWINLAEDGTHAAEPRWRLDAASLHFPAREITVAARSSAMIVLQERPGGRLAPWSPEAPRLHAAVIELKIGALPTDKHVIRFGWRQFGIRGSELLLNGKPVRLTGDFLHPFGPFILSRSYVRAWYQFVRDFGGNSIRPHAQPHPRHYLELADEMGLVVLDETAIFGSSIALNFEEAEAWRRFAFHYDGLVLRDRNHPSVLGWSFGNELFAIFDHNKVPDDVADGWYRRLAELGARARRLDPTRDWISCDGDGDLRGALPVWSKHFGHGTPLDRLPGVNKPLMVGESGGTYYARPAQLAEFNGSRAFESYGGRNEALAIDVYDNIVRMARPRLAYYSASETAWFGAEHLNFGYTDFARLPGPGDGVLFSKPFQEGKPGMQPERLPPYVATLNPGWDRTLPLYRPLAMFEAQKAALSKDGPQSCRWARRTRDAVRPNAPVGTRDRVGFLGDMAGPLALRLKSLGLPLVEGERLDFMLIDGSAPGWDVDPAAREIMGKIQKEGGVACVMLGAAGPINIQDERNSAPAVVTTDRPATALVPDGTHPWTASFTLPELYFAEQGAGRLIMRVGMGGPLVERGRTLLRASDTDWALFNEAPEHAKCAAVVLYEHLVKPAGAALVETTRGRGTLMLCSVDWRVASPDADRFWRRLFSNAGIRLNEPVAGVIPAIDERGALIKALSIGRFEARTIEEALAKDFIREATNRGNGKWAGLEWQKVESPSRDRFLFHQFGQGGPDSGPFAVYFSFWIRSPRALDDLLAGGPDAPRFTMIGYVAERCRLFVNGDECPVGRQEPADYRARCVFERVPLRKGWNHLLMKVVSGDLHGDRPGTLAMRFLSDPPEYLRQIESAIQPPASK